MPRRLVREKFVLTKFVHRGLRFAADSVIELSVPIGVEQIAIFFVLTLDSRVFSDVNGPCARHTDWLSD